TMYKVFLMHLTYYLFGFFIPVITVMVRVILQSIVYTCKFILREIFHHNHIPTVMKLLNSYKLWCNRLRSTVMMCIHTIFLYKFDNIILLIIVCISYKKK